MNGGSTSILNDTAQILIYLSNGDDVSRSLRFLANFAGTWFGFVGDFFDILNMDGCNVGDAVGGAALSLLVGSWLTNLSFALVAGIVNPIFLLLAIFVIIHVISFIVAEIKSGIGYVCRTR